LGIVFLSVGFDTSKELGFFSGAGKGLINKLGSDLGDGHLVEESHLLELRVREFGQGDGVKAPARARGGGQAVRVLAVLSAGPTFAWTAALLGLWFGWLLQMVQSIRS
jgi:hypothetical protein